MTPFLEDADCTLWHGDVLDVLRELPAESVDCVVTSPPYWGLRSYLDDGHDDKHHEMGLEPTPDMFVAAMVEVFREVRRVLAEHGTCWVNLGDSYANDGKWGGQTGGKHVEALHGAAGGLGRDKRITGLKPKDLVGIPWRVAFALQADGWWLRSDIVWAKPNPMPESVTDRPTKSHEYVFLLTKAPRYFFDQEAVREPAEWARWGDQTTPKHAGSDNGAWMKPQTKEMLEAKAAQGRNVRSVWTIATQPYANAHFATYPEELVRRCVLAGCPVRVCTICGEPSVRQVERELVGGHMVPNARPAVQDAARGDAVGGIYDGARLVSASYETTTLGWSDCGHNDWRPGRVLDPFAGSGTTCKVARDHGRSSIGIDLNEAYLELAARRLQQQSLFSEPAA